MVHFLIASTDVALVKTVGRWWAATAILFGKDGKTNFVTSVVVVTVGADETHKAGGV